MADSGSYPTLNMLIVSLFIDMGELASTEGHMGFCVLFSATWVVPTCRLSRSNHDDGKVIKPIVAHLVL